MNTRQIIDEAMIRRRLRKHPNYDAFADELARYVEMMRPAKLVDQNPQYQKVREIVRKLSRELKNENLPDHQRTYWWPYPDTDGKLRAWVDDAIHIGEQLEQAAGEKARPPQIKPVLEYVATLWEKHFGKKPGLGENSPFLPLFNKVFPRFSVDSRTARRLLK